MRPIRSLRPGRPLAAAVALAAVAGGAGAQTAQRADADARWQPWYGCWSVAPDSADVTTLRDAPVTCVTPAGGAAVEVTTVANGKVASRDRLDASGSQQRYDRDGCNGWEKGDWSADGRRVYLHTELSCANNVRRTGEGMVAFTRAGEWLDVRAASVGGYTGVRTLRYRPAAAPAGLPTDVAAALGGGMGIETARLAAGAPATTADVVEVTRRAGAPVAAAWLAELRQRFPLDARQLTALADAGVPGSVTDVMVATAFPQRFALGPSGAERALRTAPPDDLGRGRPGAVAVLTPVYGGFGGWGGYGYSPYGYNAWNSGYIPGLGYYPRGGYWGSGPVVVVRPGTPAAGERARVVPGRGYTRGDEPSSGEARPSGGGSSSSGWAGSPSTSRGSTSSEGSASSGGGGRTAKPRP